MSKYTPRQLDFLQSGYMHMNTRSLAKAFNETFGSEKTEGQIKSTLQNHKMRCGRKHKDRLIARKRIFTEQQERFIRGVYNDISVKELATRFNSRFEKQITREQMKSYVSRYKITSGRTGCFEKKHRPWNAGTKGVMKPNSGNFKKGSIPANIKPFGHERVCPKDGFILIKVAGENPWTGVSGWYRHKQRHVYEQEFGPIPDGMVVAFRDSDKLNCDPDNLMLISRAELLRLNKHGYKDMPAQLKPCVLALSKLEVKTREKGKSNECS